MTEILREALALPSTAVMGDVIDKINHLAVERRALVDVCSKILNGEDPATVMLSRVIYRTTRWLSVLAAQEPSQGVIRRGTGA